MNLEWTTEKPTKPGEYLFRANTTTQGQTIRIHTDKGGVYRECYRGSLAGAWVHKAYAREWRRGYWLGPLPEVKT